MESSSTAKEFMAGIEVSIVEPVVVVDGGASVVPVVGLTGGKMGVVIL